MQNLIDYDDVTRENKTKHNLTLHFRPSIQNTNNGRLSVRKNEHMIQSVGYKFIDQIYLSIKDLNELKCQYHIRQYEKVGFDHYKEPN